VGLDELFGCNRREWLVIIKFVFGYFISASFILMLVFPPLDDLVESWHRCFDLWLVEEGIERMEERSVDIDEEEFLMRLDYRKESVVMFRMGEEVVRMVEEDRKKGLS
jgi:hypothetical protein